jgi:hypothetical protein
MELLYSYIGIFTSNIIEYAFWFVKEDRVKISLPEEEDPQEIQLDERFIS